MILSPTVDAALAELDSIPDEVCESGDVEEEDEEEEEWSYYRMDLQTQPQVSVDFVVFYHLRVADYLSMIFTIYQITLGVAA